MADQMHVPERLRAPHPFVASTRDAASGRRAGPDHRIQVGPAEGVVSLLISRAQLGRALRILHALFAEAERRRWTVEAFKAPHSRSRHDNGVAIVADSHAYVIEIIEQADSVPMTDQDIAAWERDNYWRLRWEPTRTRPTTKPIANGRLKLSLPARWDGARCNGSEGPRGTLDTKLGSVLAEIARRAAQDNQRALEQERLDEERRQAAERRVAVEREQRRSEAYAIRLLGEVQAWRESRSIREYVAALRELLPALTPAERLRLVAWCDWGDAFAEDRDPLRHPTRIAGLTEDLPL